jgi:hypothetical protein
VTTIDPPKAQALAEEPSGALLVDRVGDDPQPALGPAHRVLGLLLAAGAYLLISILVFWRVWSTDPTSSTVSPRGDSALFTWFLEWPGYAISHGLNPLYSTAMFHPVGVNLLANTSELAIGVLFAPITWLFGPVATLNVALTLSPALSALAMFVLLRRWVSWAPAAFIGGFFYGFCPLILFSLSNGNLQIGMAAVPPLVVACLDEILVRQRGRPIASGVLLGLLVMLQFFLGTEVLAIIAIAGVITSVIIAYVAWQHPAALRDHARHAIVGLSAGGVTAVVLLAYPAWFALDGPAHFSGPLWPGWNLRGGGIDLGYLFLPEPASAVERGLGVAALLFQDFLVSYQYFGIGVLVVLCGGIVLWRRDRRLWLFGAVSAISVLLALGVRQDIPLPWQILVHLPMAENIIPGRFVLITYLSVSVLLGLIVDHTYVALTHRAARGDGTGRRHGSLWSRMPRWTGAAAGLAVAAIAVIPPAVYLAQDIPVDAGPVVLPTWFRTVAPHLVGHQVVLAFPAPLSTLQGAMTWQAVDQMHFSIVGGGGPGLVRAGPEQAGQSIIATASFSLLGETFKPGDIQSVRQALHGWGVTTVVIPDEPALPLYDQITSVTYAAALITAATGQPPLHQANAWVWTGVNRAGAPVFLSTARFSACTNGVTTRGVAAVDRATRCVLAAVPSSS